MHGAFTGQAAVDFLAAERQQGCGNLRHGYQRGVEGVECVGVLVEEALAGATHVPVGQRVGVLAQVLAGVPDVVGVHRRGDLFNHLAGLAEDEAVHHVLRVVLELGAVALTVVGGVGVQGEEVVDVPQRQHNLANALADALLGHNQVAAAQNRRGHQEPAHRVGAVAVEDLGDIRVVAQRLGHLLAV